jgi:hypothetical protein
MSKNVYVVTTKRPNRVQESSDNVDIHPTAPAPRAHKAIPQAIAEDWVEAQINLNNGAMKSAAVMCRRILYGILLD